MTVFKLNFHSRQSIIYLQGHLVQPLHYAGDLQLPPLHIPKLHAQKMASYDLPQITESILL